MAARQQREYVQLSFAHFQQRRVERHVLLPSIVEEPIVETRLRAGALPK
jgi:hypothetical protein